MATGDLTEDFAAEVLSFEELDGVETVRRIAGTGGSIGPGSNSLILGPPLTPVCLRSVQLSIPRLAIAAMADVCLTNTRQGITGT